MLYQVSASANELNNRPTKGRLHMPDVLIEVRGNWLKDRKVNFIEAIEDGISVY